MCLATIAVAATAASAVYGGVSAAENVSYQGQVAKNNATAARQNAAYSATAASANTESAGLKAAQRLAGVTTAQAANNIDVNTGSAADVSTSQRELGQLDVDNEATRGAQAVYGYQTQATGFSAQAAADKAQVGPDIFGGLLKAGGSIAGSAGQLGGGGGGGGGGGDFSGIDAQANDSIAAGIAANPIPGGGSLISSAPSVPSNYSWMQGQHGFGSEDWDL